MKWTIPVVLCLMLVSAGALYAGSHHFESSLEAKLDGVEKVKIEVRNGSIDVETWNKDMVEIDIDERVNRSDRDDAERIAEEAELTSRRNGSTLIIEVDYGDLDKKERNQYACSIEVRLPEHLVLNLETTNGSIAAEKMEKDLTVRTTNGSINIEGSGGDAHLRTTNGAVKAGWVAGELDVASTNGALRLEGAGGGIEARTTNGSISLDVDPESNFVVEAETTNGRIVERLSSRKFDGLFSRRNTRLVGAYGDDGKANRVLLKTTNGKITIGEA